MREFRLESASFRGLPSLKCFVTRDFKDWVCFVSEDEEFKGAKARSCCALRCVALRCVALLCIRECE